ncbi:MAG: 3'(2'),5'-bisphosphate nucleotidase CysQ [Candidatus Celerinatantimonas neptuna]|nr:MAG: 3'(2'),5'-bisphosphate nucleotidase CysQ [Candidatus Celerinatantimonas neptuna]
MTTSNSALDLLPTAASLRLISLAQAVVSVGEYARLSLRRYQNDELAIKGPRDYQTVIDCEVERKIIDLLTVDFPDYGFKGEEAVANKIADEGKPMIVIDPIDGTTNFAWGIPHFGMTIAVIEQKQVVCGVVYDPMLGELFSAELGKGAWMNGKRLHTSNQEGVKETLIGAGLPVPRQVKRIEEEKYFSALKRAMAGTSGVRRLGASSLSISYVACGRLDGFFEDGLSIHDYGAAALIVQEAGGIVSGFLGDVIGDHGDLLVASNRAVHDWLLEGFH